MRYTKDQRKNTNNRIMDIASRRFRKEGIQAVGIAGLMSDAGLTHGGFYSHFKSKEDLTIKAITKALEESFAFLEGYAEKNGNLESLVSVYLHPIHRESPETGCALAAIGPELSRRPKESQQTISEKIGQFFALIERYLPQDMGPEKRRATAMSIFSLMVGALQLSRMMWGEKQRDEVLKNAIESAMILAGVSHR